MNTRLTPAVNLSCSYVEGGDKIPTSCTGPYLQLAFEPKICVVDDAAKEVRVWGGNPRRGYKHLPCS